MGIRGFYIQDTRAIKSTDVVHLKWPRYSGLLNRKKMSRSEKQGYVSWENQRARCYRKNHPYFKYYGANGIQVKYDARSFIGWWLFNLKKKKWKDPTVDRINNNKHYSFDNIRMVERIENSRESCIRNAIGIKAIPIICKSKLTGEIITCFGSTSSAANFFKIIHATFKRRHILKKMPLNSFVFEVNSDMIS